MTLFLDAHLPPSLAPWIQEKLNIKSYSFEFVGWSTLDDDQAFLRAKEVESSVIVTKDEDFIALLNKLKSPPKIIWVTTGNTSNSYLRTLFEKSLMDAIDLLTDNDLVEIK